MSQLYKDSFPSSRSQPPPGLTSFGHLQGRLIAGVLKKEDVTKLSRRSASREKNAFRVLEELQLATRDQMARTSQNSFRSEAPAPSPSHALTEMKREVNVWKFQESKLDPTDPAFPQKNSLHLDLSSSRKDPEPVEEVPRIIESHHDKPVIVKSSQSKCCVIA